MNRPSQDLIKQRLSELEVRVKTFSESTIKKTKRNLFLHPTAYSWESDQPFILREAFLRLYKSNRDIETLTETEYLQLVHGDHSLQRSRTYRILAIFFILFGIIVIFSFKYVAIGMIIVGCLLIWRTITLRREGLKIVTKITGSDEKT